MSILNSSMNLAKIGLGAKKGAEKVAKATAKKAQIKKPIVNSLDKNGEIKKSLSNVYTGKKLNPVYVGAAATAYLGFKQAKHGFETKTIAPLKLATMSNYQEQGAPDVMMYDGVGQDRAPKNLNANGSLVFGLHNSRKG
ncbi:hypothetical protein ABWK22_02740 [Gottfriedia acidiceleris]|uniref:hypothetical protein n=1 Tax=Gottfriedia acidiceleris TaxID=371036 RepID=UPI003398A39D